MRSLFIILGTLLVLSLTSCGSDGCTDNDGCAPINHTHPTLEPTPKPSPEPPPNLCDDGFTQLCHKDSKTMCIEDEDVDSHLMHGDYLGKCE